MKLADNACYIVRGAKMKCSKGSKLVRINLPASHGSYVNGKPMMVKTDRVVGANIGKFGFCEGASCKVKILGDWMKYKEDTLVGGYGALTTQSVLVCAYGGIIRFISDGQDGG